MTFCLAVSVLGESQKERLIRAKSDEIEHLIYEEKAYGRAAELCRELVALAEGEDYSPNRAEGYINLIDNYSDHDGTPLALYFEAREYENIRFKGKAHARERVQKVGDLYRKLLRDFPDCRLAPLAHYLLGEHYRNQIGSTLRYLEDEDARRAAIDSYRTVVDEYPSALFPVTGHPWHAAQGQRIAPIALMDIAWLYRYYAHVEPDFRKALAAYQELIEEFPEAVDAKGRKLHAAARMEMLGIYMGTRGAEHLADTAKAKEICRVLLDYYPNQSYEVRRSYYGETHPAAIMTLAGLEENDERSIELYRSVLREFPTSPTGKSGSGLMVMYSVLCLDEIAGLLDNPGLVISECRDILDSRPDRTVACYAQLMIAAKYQEDLEDPEQAIIEYQKVINEYGDIVLQIEEGPVGPIIKTQIEAIKAELGRQR